MANSKRTLPPGVTNPYGFKAMWQGRSFTDWSGIIPWRSGPTPDQQMHALGRSEPAPRVRRALSAKRTTGKGTWSGNL